MVERLYKPPVLWRNVQPHSTPSKQTRRPQRPTLPGGNAKLVIAASEAGCGTFDGFGGNAVGWQGYELSAPRWHDGGSFNSRRAGNALQITDLAA